MPHLPEMGRWEDSMHIWYDVSDSINLVLWGLNFLMLINIVLTEFFNIDEYCLG